MQVGTEKSCTEVFLSQTFVIPSLPANGGAGAERGYCLSVASDKGISLHQLLKDPAIAYFSNVTMI